MCKVTLIKYTCDHKSFGPVSICRGTFAKTRKCSSLKPAKAACMSGTALTFRSSHRCGPCEHKAFTHEWDSKITQARHSLLASSMVSDPWADTSGGDGWSPYEQDIHGKVSDGFFKAYELSDERFTAAQEAYERLRELQGEHDRLCWDMNLLFPTSNRCNFFKESLVQPKIRGDSPLKNEVKADDLREELYAQEDSAVELGEDDQASDLPCFGFDPGHDGTVDMSVAGEVCDY